MILTIVLDIIFAVYGVGLGWDFFPKADWTLPVIYLEISLFCLIDAPTKRK
jgi:hypothetical protein